LTALREIRAGAVCLGEPGDHFVSRSKIAAPEKGLSPFHQSQMPAVIVMVALAIFIAPFPAPTVTRWL